MINAIALDDEPLSLEIIQKYCDQIPYLHLTHTFTSQQQTVEFLENNKVDLLFLDIHMPESNGISLYKSLNIKTGVIFTTAYKEYAIEGFNVNAIDYLLKPFSFERFLVAAEKAKDLLQVKTIKQEATHIDIKADYQVYHIPFDNILFIEAFDDYIKIHQTDSSKIVARYTMKSIVTRLPEDKFTRIHRSFIVAVNKISSIQKNKLHIGNEELPISNTYKAKLLKNFNF